MEKIKKLKKGLDAIVRAIKFTCVSEVGNAKIAATKADELTKGLVSLHQSSKLELDEEAINHLHDTVQLCEEIEFYARSMNNDIAKLETLLVEVDKSIQN